MNPKNGAQAKSKDVSTAKAAVWESVGTVVGYTSTDRFTFILRSLKGKLGDIVACRLEVPTGDRDKLEKVTVWARIIGIDRFNPFFPAEAAQELVEEGTKLLDTVLSTSRDHLEAEALILGTTIDDGAGTNLVLSPLTYPVKPSEEVLYPPTDVVQQLLTGDDTRKAPIRIGSLIGRSDVRVEMSARQVVSRHLAILAMTGGGKTVAARRIIRELVDHKYPLVIFDPHGDYLGLYEKRAELGGTEVKIFFPRIKVDESNLDIVSSLIDKMAPPMSEAQRYLFSYLLSHTELRTDCTAIEYIDAVTDFAINLRAKRSKGKSEVENEIQDTGLSTYAAVIRTLKFVLGNLKQMEANNERLRDTARFKGFEFSSMPDPKAEPDHIVRPNQVSIFYLAGYDHLNQSAIVSIVLEALFAHRSTLNDTIAPFQAVIEEAHNFIPSRREGTQETPSLVTIRKVITEGRKFGTGLVLISQRPSRLDETTLAQCNSFLVLRLVNPNDKRFVRSVMENLTEADAEILQTFGPGQGLVSGQAVKFPLLVRIDFDEDLVSRAIGDEDFLNEANAWKPSASQRKRDKNSETADKTSRDNSERKSRRTSSRGRKRRGGIKPEGYS